MRQSVIVMLVAALACVLGACSSPPPPPPSSEAQESVGAGTSSNGAAGAVSAADEEVAGPQEGMLLKRVIYFDFDSAEIHGEGTDVVAAHARYLASHANARVRLEGHTDERGSREYNIGLGERRAQSVLRAMLLQGVSKAQVSTVSYGEERPAVPGHDEGAWSKDRRVEIVYTTPGISPPAGAP